MLVELVIREKKKIASNTGLISFTVIVVWYFLEKFDRRTNQLKAHAMNEDL
jgi:hypothetical protein